jgi:hypothetical protein
VVAVWQQDIDSHVAGIHLAKNPLAPLAKDWLIPKQGSLLKKISSCQVLAKLQTKVINGTVL